MYCDFLPVRMMDAGEAFGEIALVTRSKRTATILCKENCHLIILTKASFDKILGE